MARTLREGAGVLLTALALVGIGGGVVELRGHDYLAAALLLGAGMAVLRAGVELLRPSVGE